MGPRRSGLTIACEQLRKTRRNELKIYDIPITTAPVDFLRITWEAARNERGAVVFLNHSWLSLGEAARKEPARLVPWIADKHIRDSLTTACDYLLKHFIRIDYALGEPDGLKVIDAALTDSGLDPVSVPSEIKNALLRRARAGAEQVFLPEIPTQLIRAWAKDHAELIAEMRKPRDGPSPKEMGEEFAKWHSELRDSILARELAFGVLVGATAGLSASSASFVKTVLGTLQVGLAPAASQFLTLFVPGGALVGAAVGFILARRSSVGKDPAQRFREYNEQFLKAKQYWQIQLLEAEKVSLGYEIDRQAALAPGTARKALDDRFRDPEDLLARLTQEIDSKFEKSSSATQGQVGSLLREFEARWSPRFDEILQRVAESESRLRSEFASDLEKLRQELESRIDSVEKGTEELQLRLERVEVRLSVEPVAIPYTHLQGHVSPATLRRALVVDLGTDEEQVPFVVPEGACEVLESGRGFLVEGLRGAGKSRLLYEAALRRLDAGGKPLRDGSDVWILGKSVSDAATAESGQANASDLLREIADAGTRAREQIVVWDDFPGGTAAPEPVRSPQWAKSFLEALLGGSLPRTTSFVAIDSALYELRNEMAGGLARSVIDLSNQPPGGLAPFVGRLLDTYSAALKLTASIPEKRRDAVVTVLCERWGTPVAVRQFVYALKSSAKDTDPVDLAIELGSRDFEQYVREQIVRMRADRENSNLPAQARARIDFLLSIKFAECLGREANEATVRRIQHEYLGSDTDDPDRWVGAWFYRQAGLVRMEDYFIKELSFSKMELAKLVGRIAALGWDRFLAEEIDWRRLASANLSDRGNFIFYLGDFLRASLDFYKVEPLTGALRRLDSFYAGGLLGQFSRGFPRLSREGKAAILELVEEPPADDDESESANLADRVGWGIGTSFLDLGQAERSVVLDLARRNGRFAEGLSSGLDGVFPESAESRQNEILELVSEGRVPARGLGEGIGFTFGTLKPGARAKVWELVLTSTEFAASFVGAAAYRFPSLPPEERRNLLEASRSSKGTAHRLGEAFGFVLSEFPREAQEAVLKEAHSNEELANALVFPGLSASESRFLEFPEEVRSSILRLPLQPELAGSGLGKWVGTDFLRLDEGEREAILRDTGASPYFQAGLGSRIGEKFYKLSLNERALALDLASRLEQFAAELAGTVGSSFDKASRDNRGILLATSRKNAPFGRGLGVAVGARFSDLADGTRAALIEEARNSSELRCGLLTGVSECLGNLSVELQEPIFELAETDDRSLESFLEHIDRGLSSLSPQNRRRLLAMAARRPDLPIPLGEYLAGKFSELSQDEREFLVNLITSVPALRAKVASKIATVFFDLPLDHRVRLLESLTVRVAVQSEGSSGSTPRGGPSSPGSRQEPDHAIPGGANSGDEDAPTDRLAAELGEVIAENFGAIEPAERASALRAIGRNPSFAKSFGAHLGNGFFELPPELREAILDRESDNRAFAEALGEGFGGDWFERATTERLAILNVAARSERFRRAFARRLGLAFGYLGPVERRPGGPVIRAPNLGELSVTEQQLLFRMAWDDPAFAAAMKEGGGAVFSELSPTGWRGVIERFVADRSFAEHVAYGVGCRIDELSASQRQSVIESAYASPEVADQVANGLGQVFDKLSERERHRVGEMLGRFPTFGEEFGSGLAAAFHWFPSSDRERVLALATENASVARGIGRMWSFEHSLISGAKGGNISGPDLEWLFLLAECNPRAASGIADCADGDLVLALGRMFPQLKERDKEFLIKLAEMSEHVAEPLGFGTADAMDRLSPPDRDLLVKLLRTSEGFAEAFSYTVRDALLDLTPEARFGVFSMLAHAPDVAESFMRDVEEARQLDRLSGAEARRLRLAIKGK